MPTLPGLALATGFWLVVAGPGPGSWLVGVPAILLAALLWRWLRPGPLGRPRVLPLAWLAATVLAAIVRGSWSVARFAMRPAAPPRDALRELPLALEDEGTRVLVACLMTIIPGTAALDLRSRSLLLHALDESAPVEAELARVERLVGAAFPSAARA